MDILMYIICVLVFLKYCFVLKKYIKTKEFMKVKFRGNWVGVLAYTFFTIALISIALHIALVSNDIFCEPIMFLIIISIPIFVPLFIWYLLIRLANKSGELIKEENEKMKKKVNEEFEKKYGGEEYDTFKIKGFKISDTATIDDNFNYLITALTNGQNSFVHPDMYKDVPEVFSSLLQKDYIKLYNANDSAQLLCSKINSLLKSQKLDLTIVPEDFTKDDDEFMKNRRKDLMYTVVHDINTISSIINSKFSNYELILIYIYTEDPTKGYPSYIGLAKLSDYNQIFGDRIDGEGDYTYE